MNPTKSAFDGGGSRSGWARGGGGSSSFRKQKNPALWPGCQRTVRVRKSNRIIAGSACRGSIPSPPPHRREGKRPFSRRRESEGRCPLQTQDRPSPHAYGLMKLRQFVDGFRPIEADQLPDIRGFDLERTFRNALAKDFQPRPEVTKAGVYFLVGPNPDDDGQTFVYIGQRCSNAALHNEFRPYSAWAPPPNQPKSAKALVSKGPRRLRATGALRVYRMCRKTP